MKSTILCKSIIYYQVLKVESRKLKKKLQRDDRFNMKNKPWNCRISLKVLDLFTSEFEYLVIKVSRKSGFILILCLFFRWHFFKIKRDGKLFKTRCQNFTSHILSRWLYEDITCSGLLINKTEKATDTKKSQKKF